MPNEVIISRIETLLDEVVSLGGASERTGIVSGLIVVDSAPSSAALANHIIVRDSRDGNFISVLKTPGQTYANNDLVSVLFIEGTEPIALAQSPGSSSGNVKVSEVWESDFGAVAGSADAAGNWTWQNDVTLASGNLNFSQASTIGVTGALQINATGGVVINENGIDADTRIEGSSEINVFFVDAGNNRLGSGTSTPATRLHLADGSLRIGPATDYGQLTKTAGTLAIQEVRSTGVALIDIDPIPSDGSSNSAFRFFRSVNTTGLKLIQIFRGDGSGTADHNIQGGGGYVSGAATGGDKGVGTINVSSNIYLNNSAYTNPDFILEHWVTGKIEQFKNNPGAKEYQGLMSFDKLQDYLKENLHLPGRDNEPSGIFDRADLAQRWAEELHLYVLQLHERIRGLENGNN